MFQTFKNAWKVPDLRKKILFTMMILILYRVGASLFVPYVDAATLSAVAGAIVGLVGAAFHHCLDISSEFFGKFNWLLFCMPIAGLAIVAIYRFCGFKEDKGTNIVFTAIKNGEKISLKTAPLIFVATCLTILTGGSAGREGAALQLGGSLTSFFSKIFHMNENDYKILIMCGMAAGFSSLFGTSVAAAIFAI